jgi:hypothetical protein
LQGKGALRLRFPSHLQTLEEAKKQAMQFLKIKMAAGWFGFAAGFPDILCYCRDPPCSRPCYFFRESAFSGHFLRTSLYFPC